MNPRVATKYLQDRGQKHMTPRKLLKLAREEKIGCMHENARVIWFKPLHCDRYLEKIEKKTLTP